MRLVQGTALAREAMASAAVSLYAAASLPSVRPSLMTLQLAQGLFLEPNGPALFTKFPTASGKPLLQIFTPFKVSHTVV